MPKHDGIIELVMEEVECEHGHKTWVLALDVTAGKKELEDLTQRIKVTLDEWLSANGIMISHGEGPDGCKYGGKPN